MEKNSKYSINSVKFNQQAVLQLEDAKVVCFNKACALHYNKRILNFSDSEPLYSDKLYSCKKSVYIMKCYVKETINDKNRPGIQDKLLIQIFSVSPRNRHHKCCRDLHDGLASFLLPLF